MIPRKKLKQVNTGDKENSSPTYTDPKSVKHSNHANVPTRNPLCVLAVFGTFLYTSVFHTQKTIGNFINIAYVVLFEPFYG